MITRGVQSRSIAWMTPARDTRLQNHPRKSPRADQYASQRHGAAKRPKSQSQQHPKGKMFAGFLHLWTNARFLALAKQSIMVVQLKKKQNEKIQEKTQGNIENNQIACDPVFIWKPFKKTENNRRYRHKRKNHDSDPSLSDCHAIGS